MMAKSIATSDDRAIAPPTALASNAIARLPPQLDRITSPPTSGIESLAKALLGFTAIDDVIQWLAHQ
jgi:hypothetical protein